MASARRRFRLWRRASDSSRYLLNEADALCPAVWSWVSQSAWASTSRRGHSQSESGDFFWGGDSRHPLVQRGGVVAEGFQSRRLQSMP